MALHSGCLSCQPLGHDLLEEQVKKAPSQRFQIASTRKPAQHSRVMREESWHNTNEALL
jgi:hypothetical protein